MSVHPPSPDIVSNFTNAHIVTLFNILVGASFWFLLTPFCRYIIPREIPQRGHHSIHLVGKICDLVTNEIAVYLGNGTRSVTVDHLKKVIGGRSIRVSSDDLEGP